MTSIKPVYFVAIQYTRCICVKTYNIYWITRHELFWDKTFTYIYGVIQSYNFILEQLQIFVQKVGRFC